MRFYLALLVAKLTSFIGKRLGRGSSLPGYLALKIDPDILTKIEKKQPSVFVTGTNGKTSTTSYIAATFEAAGKKVIHNRSGANMTQGISSILLDNCSLAGQLKGDILVLEVDEAYVKEIADQLQPDYLIITNIFEDQIDRFSSLAMVQDLLEEGITNSMTLLVNADDPYVVELANRVNNQKIYFSMDINNIESTDVACPSCSKKLEYDSFVYDHLGKYSCSCGFKKPEEITYQAVDVNLNDQTMRVNDHVYNLNNAAIYNAYNLLATVALSKEMGLANRYIQETLSKHEVGKGRMESITIDGQQHLINLVKNTVGINESLQYINNNSTESINIFLSIHSREPDSDNIDWLRELDFNLLKRDFINNLIITGDEGFAVYQMFKEKGLTNDSMKHYEDIDEAIELVLKDKLPVYFLCNYSSLEIVRNKLVER